VTSKEKVLDKWIKRVNWGELGIEAYDFIIGYIRNAGIPISIGPLHQIVESVEQMDPLTRKGFMAGITSALSSRKNALKNQKNHKVTRHPTLSAETNRLLKQLMKMWGCDVSEAIKESIEAASQRVDYEKSLREKIRSDLEEQYKNAGGKVSKTKAREIPPFSWRDERDDYIRRLAESDEQIERLTQKLNEFKELVDALDLTGDEIDEFMRERAAKG
jgi:hypothetical protein